MVRRSFLLALAVWVIGLGLATARAETLTVVLPYPQGVFDAVLQSLVAPLSRQLGREVQVEHVPGDGGWEAIERVRSGGESVLLADAELTLALKQERGEGRFAFDQLTPVAKLTDGLSVALVAPADATYANWLELSQSIQDQPMTLASTGPDSAFGVALALLNKVVGQDFQEVRAHGPRAIFDAVVGGEAQLGLITTNLIPEFNATRPERGGVWPIMTFGAERSPLFTQTPTLAELSGDRHDDFTFSLGLYGSAAMSADSAMQIFRAIKEVENAPEIMAAPVHAQVPLRVSDGAILTEAFERDLRLVRSLSSY